MAERESGPVAVPGPLSVGLATAGVPRQESGRRYFNNTRARGKSRAASRSTPGVVDQDEPASVGLAAQHVGAQTRHRDGLVVGRGALERPAVQHERHVAGLNHALDRTLETRLECGETLQRVPDRGKPGDGLARLWRERRPRLVERDRAFHIARADPLGDERDSLIWG